MSTVVSKRDKQLYKLVCLSIISMSMSTTLPLPLFKQQSELRAPFSQQYGPFIEREGEKYQISY